VPSPLTTYGPHPTRNALTAARLDRDWSQGELGRRAGIARETVCRLERGYECPSWRTAVALARTLGLAPHALFPLNDEAPDDQIERSVTSSMARHGHHVLEEE